MMKFEPLPTIDESEPLCEANAKLRTKLVKRLSALEAQREQLASDLAKAEAAESKWTPQQMQDLRGRHIDLLRSEGQLRCDVETYLLAIESDRQRAIDGAQRRLDAETAKLREGLLALGYREGPVCDGGVLSLINDMYFRHPALFELRQQVQAARDKALTRDALNNNREALVRVRGVLDELRKSAMALV